MAAPKYRQSTQNYVPHLFCFIKNHKNRVFRTQNPKNDSPLRRTGMRKLGFRRFRWVLGPCRAPWAQTSSIRVWVGLIKGPMDPKWAQWAYMGPYGALFFYRIFLDKYSKNSYRQIGPHMGPYRLIGPFLGPWGP